MVDIPFKVETFRDANVKFKDPIQFPPRKEREIISTTSGMINLFNNLDS